MTTAIVLGRNLEYIETLEGKTSAGTFTYKVDRYFVGIGPIGVWRGGKEDKVEYSYKAAVDFGPKLGRVVVYQWDGKNLNQISLSESGVSSVTVDWAKDWELGKFAEEAVLKRPEDNLASALKWMTAIAIIVACIVTIWNSNHAASVISKSAANTPAANISQQNGQILRVLIGNVIPGMQKQMNLTDNLLRNQTQYYNLHGG